MNITIKEFNNDLFSISCKMITDLINYHRKLTNAPKEYWQTDEQSRETLVSWLKEGTVFNIFFEDDVVGLFYLKFGGQNVAWLEDVFILEEFRRKGIGTVALQELDKIMIEKNIISMFVDVAPRNKGAIKLYKECGFDHLNLIQLRKNYDKKLDKEEIVNILDFEFKKY